MNWGGVLSERMILTKEQWERSEREKKAAREAVRNLTGQSNKEPVLDKSVRQFDKRAYQREYMRARRAKQRGES